MTNELKRGKAGPKRIEETFDDPQPTRQMPFHYCESVLWVECIRLAIADAMKGDAATLRWLLENDGSIFPELCGFLNLSCERIRAAVRSRNVGRVFDTLFRDPKGWTRRADAAPEAPVEAQAARPIPGAALPAVAPRDGWSTRYAPDPASAALERPLAPRDGWSSAHAVPVAAGVSPNSESTWTRSVQRWERK
jgi:hypothetical protein